MSTVDTTPVFQRNFDHFMQFLRDDEVGPTSISPKRFGQVLKVDLQTLAAQAHVHRNTVRRAPDSESIQKYLREALRVVRAAVDIAGDVEDAIYWYKNHPIATFDYKTAQDVVSEGKTEQLIRYIQSLQSGFSG